MRLKVWIAAYYEFTKNIRDLKLIAFIIVFPILMILILGMAIQSIFSADSAKRIPVAYVNLDHGIVGQQFDGFLKQKDIAERIKITPYSSKKEGEEAVSGGKVSSMIYLPDHLSQSIQDGKSSSIEVSGKKDSEFVQSLAEGFKSGRDAANAVLITGGTPAAVADSSEIQRITYTKNTKFPKAIDYYSVLTLLQMLISGAFFGVFISSKSLDSDLHIRMHSLPVRRSGIIAGKVMGSVAFLFLCSLVVMLFTIVVFHANWNGNPLVIGATLLLFSSIVIGMGVIIGQIIKSFSTALMLIVCLMILFATASGAITPTNNLVLLKYITPNYYAKMLIFGTIYGYSQEIMRNAALSLGAFVLVTFSLVALFQRRVRHDTV